MPRSPWGIFLTVIDHYQVAYSTNKLDYLTVAYPTMREALAAAVALESVYRVISVMTVYTPMGQD